MANLFVRTYTFVDGTTAYGSQVEAEIGNIVTVLNNLNTAATTWGVISVANAVAVPLIADCSAGTQHIADFKNNSVIKASIGSTGIINALNGVTVSGASLTMSGQTIAMGANKITGLAAASANGDAIRYEQVINQRVLQIVTNASNPSVTTTSATFTSATSAITITPSSTTSKILLFVSGNATNANTGTTNGYFTISGTANGNLGDATIGLASAIGTSGSLSMNITMFASDTPGTVSAQTYTVQYKSTGGAIISFGSGPVKIIAVEIG